MLVWFAHFIERHSWLHRIALRIWKLIPPKPAGLLRGLLTTSWTVGAVAVIIDDLVDPPQVLLVQHSYRRRGSWGLPGGSLEARFGNRRKQHETSSDDVLESTLRRELLEELGIEINVGKTLRIDAAPYVPEEPGLYRLNFFYQCWPKLGFPWLRDSLSSGLVSPRSPEIAAIRMAPMNGLSNYDLYYTDARFLSEHLPGITDSAGIPDGAAARIPANGAANRR